MRIWLITIFLENEINFRKCICDKYETIVVLIKNIQKMSIKITLLWKIKQDNKNTNSMGTIYENRLIIIVWYDKIKFKKCIWYKYKIIIVFI